MWPGWESHYDAIAGTHLAPDHHHAHDPALADERTVRRTVQNRPQQSRTEILDLTAGIAEARHFHDRLIAQAQPSPSRQAEQIDALRGHILAKMAGRDAAEAVARQFVEQLGMDEMDLPQIGLRGIDSHP